MNYTESFLLRQGEKLDIPNFLTEICAASQPRREIIGSAYSKYIQRTAKDFGGFYRNPVFSQLLLTLFLVIV